MFQNYKVNKVTLWIYWDYKQNTTTTGASVNSYFVGASWFTVVPWNRTFAIDATNNIGTDLRILPGAEQRPISIRHFNGWVPVANSSVPGTGVYYYNLPADNSIWINEGVTQKIIQENPQYTINTQTDGVSNSQGIKYNSAPVALESTDGTDDTYWYVGLSQQNRIGTSFQDTESLFAYTCWEVNITFEGIRWEPNPWNAVSNQDPNEDHWEHGPNDVTLLGSDRVCGRRSRRTRTNASYGQLYDIQRRLREVLSHLTSTRSMLLEQASNTSLPRTDLSRSGSPQECPSDINQEDEVGEPFETEARDLGRVYKELYSLHQEQGQSIRGARGVQTSKLKSPSGPGKIYKDKVRRSLQYDTGGSPALRHRGQIPKHGQSNQEAESVPPRQGNQDICIVDTRGHWHWEDHQPPKDSEGSGSRI
jgi:hypothetical protein